jgi:propanol-preferring alcohol dehydrogenase
MQVGDASATEAGWVRDGGYAEYVIVPSRRYIFGLEAPLADAGLTPYRTVRQVSRWLTKGRVTAVVLGVGALG